MKKLSVFLCIILVFVFSSCTRNNENTTFNYISHAGNIQNGGYIIKHTNDNFYADQDYYDNLHKITDSNNDITFFSGNHQYYEMNIYNDILYYISGMPGQVWKIDLNSGSKRRIINKHVENLIVYKDNLYYRLSEEDDWGKLYKTDLKGKNKQMLAEKVKKFCIYDDVIYYCDSNKSALYSMNTDGTNVAEINSSYVGNILVENNKLIYADDNRGGKLYTYDLSSKTEECISEDKCWNLNCNSQWIFYRNQSEKGNLYCISFDGSEKHKLVENSVCDIVIIDDIVLYRNIDNDLEIEYCKLSDNISVPTVFDGGGQTVIPEKDVYYNKSANYLFEIPDTFLDYYSVFEHNNGERVTFIFNGKSDYVKNYCAEKNIPGIELFTIYSENDKELAGDEGPYDDGFGKANNVRYYFTRPYDYDVFTDEAKNSLQGEQLDDYLQDEQKFKSIYNKIYYTLAIENSFVGFGNYKTDPDDKGIYLSDAKGKYSPPPMPQSNVYVNEKCGYQLTFPEDWLGWYYIDESPDGILSVDFFGKSMSGSYYMTYLSERFEESEKMYGLNMFSIVTKADVETHTYDNIKYIGTAKGVEYYSVTGTGATLTAVYMPQEIWEDITEEEYQLAKKDWEKVQQMDYNEVTKTFKNLQ